MQELQQDLALCKEELRRQVQINTVSKRRILSNPGFWGECAPSVKVKEGGVGTSGCTLYQRSKGETSMVSDATLVFSVQSVHHCPLSLPIPML